MVATAGCCPNAYAGAPLSGAGLATFFSFRFSFLLQRNR